MPGFQLKQKLQVKAWKNVLLTVKYSKVTFFRFQEESGNEYRVPFWNIMPQRHMNAIAQVGDRPSLEIPCWVQIPPSQIKDVGA